MKKKALLLTSIGAVFLVGISAIAISGIGQLNKLNTPVKANATGYSVTFTENNTTVETVGDYYAICTTTERGAKVGVMGYDNWKASFTFNKVSFVCLLLYDTGKLQKVGAYGFSHITGFAISFSGGSVGFDGNTDIDSVVSGHEYTGLSNTSADSPQFFTSDNVIVTSLTIWYSC